MSLSQPNDFAADVLDAVKRRRLTFHGCPPWCLEYKDNGDLKMWFYGMRKGKPWGGGVTIKKRPDIENAYLRGNTNAFVEALEQIVDYAQARFK